MKIYEKHIIKPHGGEKNSSKRKKMKIGKERKYPTDGESGAHGYTYETTITIERDEIIDELTDAILSDRISENYELCFEDEYEVCFPASEFIWNEDLDDIYRIMEEKLIDDDYGTDKAYDLVRNLLENLFAENFEYETEAIRRT